MLDGGGFDGRSSDPRRVQGFTASAATVRTSVPYLALFLIVCVLC